MGSRQMEINAAQPAVPAHPAPAEGLPGPQSADPAVEEILAALGTLAETPVPEHHAVYTALHDSLLAELNAEPSEEH